MRSEDRSSINGAEDDQRVFRVSVTYPNKDLAAVAPDAIFCPRVCLSDQFLGSHLN